MTARVRWRGTTKQRGYGYTHQQARNAALAMFQPGQPCVRCGHPIWVTSVMINGRDISVVDLGHSTDRTAYVGLEHRACNRGDGARRRNAAAGQAKRWAQARLW